MINRQMKVILFGALAVIFLVSVVQSGSINAIPVEPVSDLEQIRDATIIEGTPVFVTSAAGDDYVDTTNSVTYGSVSDQVDLDPGMGSNDASYTTLQEQDYYASTTLIQQTTFSSKPSGWEDDLNIDYDGDINDKSNQYSGYIQTLTFDTSSYDYVTFTLGIEVISGVDFGASAYFWDGSAWDPVYTYPAGAGKTDRSVTKFDSQYQHSNFRVRISYGRLTLDSGSMKADNWRVYGFEHSGERFQAVFRFNGVDFGTYVSEKLYVEFGAGSDFETLDFRFAAGDPTPGTIIISGQSTNFNVDIHDHLTGSTCYLDMRDSNRVSTESGNPAEWRISRVYIKLTNADPQNDAAPTCSNIDDVDYLYGMYKYYQITTYHSDADGRDNIEEVYLDCYDDSQSVMYWSFLYDGSFSEYSDTSDYVTIIDGSTGGTGTDLEVTFNVMINWNHPDISDIDLRCTVKDIDSSPISNYYEVNWNIETRLDLSTNTLGDSSGTTNRGDIDGSILASGEVNYYGSLLHPNETLVDVHVLCAAVSSSPWAGTNYDGSNGQFSVTVQADDEVGSDSYSFKVVAEGGGSEATNLLASPMSLTYIADQIVCVSLSSPSNIIDSAAMGYMDVELQYAFDTTAVVDGTYQLGNRWLTHMGGGNWQANHTPNMLTSITYDSITTASINAHGITSVNMSSQSLTMYWEQLICFIDGPVEDTFTIGENATGIHVSAEYYYYLQHGYQYYDGTLTLNNTVYQYDTIGTRGYTVSSAAGDDTFGITTIYSSEDVSYTWVYPEPPPSWNVEPSNQLSEYGEPFSYQLDADIQYGPETWWVNDTDFTISEAGLLTNTTPLILDEYHLQVWVNDTYGRELTATFIVYTSDTTAPTWLNPILNTTIEVGDSFRYNLNATDISGIDSWRIGNDTYFSIDSETGVVRNASKIYTGIYSIDVFVNDTKGYESNITFDVIVQDTRNPEWTILIANQVEEYRYKFEYILGAADAAGIKSWTLNDSVHFHIDWGIIENNTILEVGTYWLNVTVTDNNDNSISEVFSVFINDTINPIWDYIPANQDLEYGLDFIYDLDATDLANITWYINDTINFEIDINGVIRNITDLTVQTYELLITVEDSHGNTISESFSLLVDDRINPVWVSDPEYQLLEYGDQFNYDLDAFDLAEISTWSIDDMVNFTIDSSGIVNNKTVLEVGNYSLHVTATDGHGNSLDGYFILEVEDTIPPNWDIVPLVQDLEYDEQLSLQLHVSDLSGIFQWQVNNTANFTISENGFLTSHSNLDSGWYFVEVTATDGHGLSSSIVVSVFVALSTTTTSPPINPIILILTIGGIAIGAVVLFASLKTWRAIQRDRLKQLENGKGDVDTALDYLDSIKPDLEGKEKDT